MAELKTKASDQSVEAFLNSIDDEHKRQGCFALVQIMQAVTRLAARLARLARLVTVLCGSAALASIAVLVVLWAAEPAFAAGEVCFATASNGAFVYSSTNAAAVQQAVDAANPGGTVKVAGTCAGVQPGAGFTQTVLIGDSLTLRGGYTRTNWTTAYPLTQPTTLDAQGQGRVLLISAPNVVLDGLILRRGSIAGDGGAVFAFHAITLSRVSMISNTATGNGGGLLAAAGLTLSDSQVHSNTSGSTGGGVLAYGASRVVSSSFSGNFAADQGGGAFFALATFISGSTFSDNTAGALAGGAYVGGAAQVINSVFQGNRATNANAQGGGLMAGTTSEISRTRFISNQANVGGGANLMGMTRLSHVTAQSNTASGSCGGVRANALLVADVVTFTLNQAVAGNGGAACAENGAQVTRGVFISNTSSSSGGGISVLGAASAFTDTTFVANTSSATGGGVYAALSVQTVGSEWTNNSAQTCGGLRTGGLLSAQSVTLTLNRATSNGGGVCADGGAQLAGSRVQSNTSSANGGGLYSAGSVTLTAVSVISNTGQTGGGVYAGGNLNAQDTSWDRNTARGSCGGLRAAGLFAGTQVTFTRNVATGVGGSGGGACAVGGAQVLDGVMASNQAATSGGAFHIGSGGATFTNALFASNAVTSADGGGLYVAGAARLISVTFDGNRAPNTFGYGGGAYLGSDAWLTNTTFTGNRAGQGGGVHVRGNGAASASIVNAVFARNASIGGDGAAVYAAGLGGDDRLTIVHTTIASPTQAMSAAVYIMSGIARITNTIIASHSVGIRNAAASVSQDYNLFSGNAQNTSGAVSHGGHSITNGVAGFVAPGSGDYHLRGSSDAIDAGANLGIAFDRDGASRPFGPRPDMGAYEWQVDTFYAFLPVVVRP